jgi:hypothetical protein
MCMYVYYIYRYTYIFPFCTIAMGVSRMIIVGNRKINTFGNKNTNRFIKFDYFDKIDDCHVRTLFIPHH